jgi:hypothetical protein
MGGSKISIRENLELINERIAAASSKAGRSDDIQLIAVTKTIDLGRIREAIEAGATDIGENKVQELSDKMKSLGTAARYHMIGHLQTNKVKYIADSVHLIHSLDRLSLAEEINKRAKKIGRIIDVLIQVNVSGEDTKFGISPAEAIPFIESALKYDSLKIKGLMTIAPFVEEESILRRTFNGLYELGERIKTNSYKEIDFQYLSMGMTNDFEIAIEEGSNMVRVGTGIFGKRNY